MVNTTTHMYREIRDIPDATRMLLTDGREQIRAAAAKLRDADPNLIITVARGSSDHAATHFKYACELTIGVPVASIGPSIVSIYGAKLKLENSACIGISQSGQSPDIVEMVRSARQQGAVSVAITNEAASPLARACDHTVGLYAGIDHTVGLYAGKKAWPRRKHLSTRWSPDWPWWRIGQEIKNSSTRLMLCRTAWHWR